MEVTMTSTWQREGLSIDQRLALKTAASNLAREFAGIFGAETIERFLHSSYNGFAGCATITRFLPLLAERFARQRLTGRPAWCRGAGAARVTGARPQPKSVCSQSGRGIRENAGNQHG
jgi:hypothetical protein